MLYYAGFGRSKPAHPSRVVIGLGGTLHLRSQVNILKALSALTGVLDITEEYAQVVPKRGKCLKIPIKEFTFGFENHIPGNRNRRSP